MKLPRTVAAWTIAVFGGLALLLGAVGLISPEAVLGMLGFEVLAPDERAVGDYTRTFVIASSMASFNMGVYYLLAAATEWRPFFRFTVVFRLVTFAVFTTAVLTGVAPAGFFGVALWEGLGAVATGVGLWLDRRRNGNQPVTASGAGGRTV
ncbi:hypothetical protein [Micromonospora sp. HM5-17]|jgi:hypothetical protein|uniref:hypothetical protein n=1 Tax=Micromonospora sp. HM5-17 TaxID=2487710 RepID=UPI000F48B91C|nr:hypothetical protein [Micromonospora sp. HM5-17]ROT28008.1 hypothetical protein EF879_22515 [Micromonospora sp. HM5-17]